MKKSIWAVVAGVLVIVGLTTVVDIVLHVAGVYPPWTSRSTPPRPC